MSRSAISRQLRRLDHLPVRPETLYHMLLCPERLTVPQINRLLAADPALAALALRLMPKPQRHQKLRICQLAAATTPAGLLVPLATAAEPPWAAGEFTAQLSDRLWLHSQAVAHAARFLSRQRGYPHADTAFLAGLLHDLGLLALAKLEPELVARCLEPADDQTDMLDSEQELLGSTHTALGRQLAEAWQLPRWLRNVAAWHHHGSSLPSRLSYRPLVEIVREAAAALVGTPFALFGRSPGQPLGPTPWQTSDPLLAVVARGVRQSWHFLRDLPSHEPDQLHQATLRRALELAGENAELHQRWDWQLRAWSNRRRLAADARPQELTRLVAETVQEAAAATAVLCCVPCDGGARAEATFCSDVVRSITCQLNSGPAEHALVHSVVEQLPQVWRSRPFQDIPIQNGAGALAHILVWPDRHQAAGREAALGQAAELAAQWLTEATQHWESQQELESLMAALREQEGSQAGQLEEAKLAALAEFAAGAGHEFNNPLAVISGRTQLLLAEEQDQRRRRWLEIIAEQAQRIHRMIVELMQFARPAQPQMQPVDVLQWVERALRPLRPAMQEKQIELSWRPLGTLPTVSGDLDQLCTALRCIVQNSIDAVGPGGQIGITASDADGGASVEVRVTDSGGGLDPQVRQHAFEPLYSGRDAGRGLGMGLPKAWRLVRLHGGSITINDVPGGTEVVIRLPAQASQAEQRACA